MDSTKAAVEEYDLIDALRKKMWLKLPLAVMQDVGPAAQTMGGMLKLSNRKTYARVAGIASKACLPVPTVRKHLVTLAENGWITNAGREHTSGGAPRRTCTLRITAKTRKAIGEYAILPWWATTGQRLTWASKAVLSIVMSRLASLVKTVREMDGKDDTCDGDFWGSIENLNGDDRRFIFSRDDLAGQTGLDLKSITKAKRDLEELGIIHWYHRERSDGGGYDHILEPRQNFKIRIRPASESHVFVDWV